MENKEVLTGDFQSNINTMDRILLSSIDVETLLKWRDNNADLVRRNPAPFKGIILVILLGIWFLPRYTSLNIEKGMSGKFTDTLTAPLTPCGRNIFAI